MPVIIGDKDDIVSHIKKVEGKPLTFTLSGVYPKKYDGMTLEPFYRLYECRYMVYWPVWSQQELNAKQGQLEKEESERAAIDKITSDKVTCGEQQPESDHFIQMDKSQTGNDDGKHWREAEGWFSYKMKSNGKDVNKVRVLFNSFGKRSGKVLIDGTEIGTFTTSGTPSVSSCEFEIPASMKGKEEMVIKIEKNIGRVTPHIYEVRLIAQ